MEYCFAYQIIKVWSKLSKFIGESAIHPSFLAWDILIRFLSELDPLSRIKYSEAIEQKFVFAFLARFFSELPEPEKSKNFLYNFIHNYPRQNCFRFGSSK